VGAAGLPPEDTTPSSKAETYHHGEIGDEIMSSSPDSIMGRLRGISRTLRASSPEEIDTASLLLDVKDISNTYTNEMKSFKQILEDEDREGIISMIKSSVGNSHYYIEAAKEIESGSDMDITSAIVLQDDFDLKDLDDIPTSDLVKMLQPVSELVDYSIENNKELGLTIDNVLGTFPSKKSRRNLNQVFNFDFGQEDQGFTTNFHPFQGSFSAASSADVLDSTSAIIRKHSPHLEESHEVRHDRRLESLKEGGSCLPPCSATDKLCNCKKLANCASQMSPYDLGVLMGSGFIDKEFNSKTFGNFTTEKINLYGPFLTDDIDKGLLFKWKRMKDLSDSISSISSFDETACTLLLNEFVMACPFGKKCTSENNQMFQATTDEICSAVNTDVKLNFGEMYEHFEGHSSATVGVSGRRSECVYVSFLCVFYHYFSLTEVEYCRARGGYSLRVLCKPPNMFKICTRYWFNI